MEVNYLPILYWFCHTSTWIRHRYTHVPHPESPSLPLSVPSLWVVPVHQPQATGIMHQTWTGDSFHIWYYTCFNAILPNHHKFFKCNLKVAASKPPHISKSLMSFLCKIPSLNVGIYQFDFVCVCVERHAANPIYLGHTTFASQFHFSCLETVFSWWKAASIALFHAPFFFPCLFCDHPLILWSSSYSSLSLDKLRLSKQNPEPSLWHPKPIALVFLHRDVTVHVWWLSQHVSFLPLFHCSLPPHCKFLTLPWTCCVIK